MAKAWKIHRILELEGRVGKWLNGAAAILRTQPTLYSVHAKRLAGPRKQYAVFLSSKPQKFKVSLEGWFFLPLDRILLPYSSSLALSLCPRRDRTMHFLSSQCRFSLAWTLQPSSFQPFLIFHGSVHWLSPKINTDYTSQGALMFPCLPLGHSTIPGSQHSQALSDFLAGW